MKRRSKSIPLAPKCQFLTSINSNNNNSNSNSSIKRRSQLVKLGGSKMI